MKPARIIVLVIALAAGGIAALLASRTDAPPPVQAPIAQIETTEVLVASRDIGLGNSVQGADLRWQVWPTDSISPFFVRKDQRPDAINQLGGSVTRQSFAAGEPIREARLIKSTGSGYMAAILPSGKRAISTDITPETGAGGFILPNDRVDVILSKREKNVGSSGGPDIINSEVILPNVRVLAIDQAPKEKDGQNAVVGKTVTLELKPEQAETLARSRQTGTLSLALRSITDVNVVQGGSEEQAPKRSSSINVVRYGVANQSTAQK